MRAPGRARLFARGQHEADWLGPYDFLWRAAELRCIAPLEPLLQLALTCGWWLVHRNWQGDSTAIASEKPLGVHLLGDRLHNPTGPSLEFLDGTACWHLHGVAVPRRFVVTPAADIPLTWWLDEPRASRRKVLEEKIGPTRIADELGAREIDSTAVHIGQGEHHYRLLHLRVPGGGVRRALSMLNPSTGETHTEWVAREVETVEEALA